MVFNLRSLREPALNRGSLESRINRLFNDAFGGFEWPLQDRATAWAPAVDIFEDENAIRITAEVPGVRPEDVKVTHENNVLTIQGTKLPVGTFERSFTLPTTVDAAGIKAGYEHGVLTLTLPKAEQAKPKVIEVQVSSK